jgi:uncharacterized protein
MLHEELELGLFEEGHIQLANNGQQKSIFLKLGSWKMEIAIIGGGASGMVTAYALDKQGHHVTVFERQSVLGGHIRTLNQNVQSHDSDCSLILENGVLEFPTVFHNFMALMTELGVELEPVTVNSTLFMKNGGYHFSDMMLQQSLASMQRLVDYSQSNSLYDRSIRLWSKAKSWQISDFPYQSLLDHSHYSDIRSIWLKLFSMYSHTVPVTYLDDYPAELVVTIWMLRSHVFEKWVRIKGGVYSYIQKILDRFHGQIRLGVKVAAIRRTAVGVSVQLASGASQEFDKVVLATPPDQVLKLLADPRQAEVKRFISWQGNSFQTVLHSDASMYERYQVKQRSALDFFQTDRQQGYWGYNYNLNQRYNLTSARQYNLSFNLESLIEKDYIIHTQQHHAPLYTVEALRHRNEIIKTNGDYHTYHVGAYLGDGLHEGAIASAMQVANLIKGIPQVMGFPTAASKTASIWA